MRGDDERTLGGGVGAAIFVMPLVFGWLVFRREYHPGVRAVVGAYMALTVIPLYLLISIFWTSGDEVKRLARDYDRNRAVAERNAGTAQSYMTQYDKGDLADNKSPAPTAIPSPSSGPITLAAVTLAKQVETDRALVGKLSGHEIKISGRTSGPAKGQRVFLEGGELYPAVILDYAGAPPGVGEVTATCSTIRLDTIGPILGGCQ